MKEIRIALAITVLLGHACLIAQSAARKPGDTLTYEAVDRQQITGGKLPPQAYAPRPPFTHAVKISVLSVDADGNAQVHVTLLNPFPAGVPGRAAAVAVAKAEWEASNRYKEFDARFTRDGALLVAADNSLQADNVPTGLSLAQTRDAMIAEAHNPAYQAKLAKNEAAAAFGVFNAVVLSCAKKTAFAAGDTWHVVSKSDGATYDVAVIGKQPYHGHDTVALSAKTHLDNPGGSIDVDATVYYDPQARLVVGMHTVNVSTIKVTGMASTATSDLNLKE
jgi:hypothetical protein